MYLSVYEKIGQEKQKNHILTIFKRENSHVIHVHQKILLLNTIAGDMTSSSFLGLVSFKHDWTNNISYEVIRLILYI